ncbi:MULTISPECIES: CcdC family protein [Thermoactinomyces]|uniref:Cytochrome c biogenesis protein CcdC n=1 Tax=Thermoactinomyces daqus TaxID=1329516 RepID=A0A7W1X9T4_9BACL|nr:MULTISPECIES: cytochrome c biogenesis protein CcdC [Thermoactinomyces]MBA4542660.1 cytochrome c biogenesis protein CcdC [Thermoactinomyces daqus]MBH8597359.1 cytochrome c biogenesis protein CcdC [Thermoactinomyces sp. CICC 10523]MBH8602920.1 cytochrome c biogenesis protein CcdC [Thermoactinomyces sp. CICC 10522]MBH8607232.1 cytochrome c biogenesis protein CcdC [Thermoactinomyces sp. CICC 10521]
MVHSFPISLNFVAPIFALIMASMVIVIRLRATNKPTNARKILIPPLGMSTGFLMFLYPPMRVPWAWAGVAFLAGALLFSYPLIKTSHFEMIDGKVYLKRSRAFILILIGLFILRMVLHDYLEHLISVEQTAALFFILAFGMLLPWRLAMYLKYRKLQEKNSLEKANAEA